MGEGHDAGTDAPAPPALAAKKPVRKKAQADLVVEALHNDPAWGLPDTPGGRMARAYFETNPVSPHRNKRERNKWRSSVLSVFDEFALSGGSEAVMIEAIRASPGLAPWDLVRKVRAGNGQGEVRKRPTPPPVKLRIYRPKDHDQEVSAA